MPRVNWSWSIYETLPGYSRNKGVLWLLLLLVPALPQVSRAHAVMPPAAKTARINAFADSTNIPPTLTLSHTDISCNGRNDGSITAAASKGKGYYQYSRDNGHSWQNDPVFTQLPAGTYTIIVQDSAQLQDTATIQLKEPAALAISEQHATASCYGNAQISVQPSGGTSPYTYSLDSARTWQAANYFSKLLPGDYSILVKDQHECMTSAWMHITSPDPINIELSAEHATCYESSTGRISVKASGGELPYEYSKDGRSWQDDPVFEKLARGAYKIYVRDHNGCILDKTIEVTAPQPLTMRTQNQDAVCYGNSNGSISVQAQGGTQPYRYTNNNGLTWQTTPDFQGISAGNYTVMVLDSNACMTYEQVTLKEPTFLYITSAKGIFNGTTDCSITMVAGGGTPDYSYSIGRNQPWQSASTFDNVVSGSYPLYVKDQHGCRTGLILTVATSPVVQLVMNSWGPSCYQGANGNVTVNAEGGQPPYRYSKDDGASWQSQNRFAGPAGVYNILVEDNNGKQVRSQVTLNEPTLLTARVESTDVTCRNAANGSIHTFAGGGSPPYKYSINNGATWQSNPNFIGLPGGHYTIMVKDAGYCDASTVVDLYEPLVLHTTGKSSAVTCHGGANGSIMLTTNGGTAPYQYTKDHGLTWQDNAYFEKLSRGTYKIYVRDHNGCLDSISVKVQEPAALTMKPAIRQIDCYGAANGKVTFTTSGGTTPYTYRMDNGNWQTEPVFDSLAPGNFAVTVKDANGCTYATTVSITQPYPLLLKFISATNGCSYIGGQLAVKASGGTLPYTYSLAGTAMSRTDGDFSGLAASSYEAVVTDKNGCETKLDPVAIDVSPELTLVMDEKQDMQCDGIHKGSVRFHAEGGTLPYRYSLNENTIATGDIRPLDKGAYNALVQDKYGCAAVLPFKIILLDEDCELTMPTGFSPNGDGQNDLFRPALYGNISGYKLEIFNVWGNLIFSHTDPRMGWDGYFKDRPQAAGTYVWIARYTNSKGQAVMRRGAVTLVR